MNLFPRRKLFAKRRKHRRQWLGLLAAALVFVAVLSFAVARTWDGAPSANLSQPSVKEDAAAAPRGGSS